MASCSGDLKLALSLVQDEKTSLRQAAAESGVDDSPKWCSKEHHTWPYFWQSYGTKCGLPTILIDTEERGLVEWAVKMAAIGYGCTRDQVVETVKNKAGRPNPFTDNRPGKEWWYGFLQRHPQVAMCSTEPLQLAHASACSNEKLTDWYSKFKEFLEANSMKAQ